MKPINVFTNEHRLDDLPDDYFTSVGGPTAAQVEAVTERLEKLMGVHPETVALQKAGAARAADGMIDVERLMFGFKNPVDATVSADVGTVDVSNPFSIFGERDPEGALHHVDPRGERNTKIAKRDRIKDGDTVTGVNGAGETVTLSGGHVREWKGKRYYAGRVVDADGSFKVDAEGEEYRSAIEL